MEIIIVAAGSGTRLFPITKYIPKILVNVRGQSGLYHLLTYWSQYSKNITIILASSYKQLVEVYARHFFPDLPITLITFDEQPGTAQTVHQALSTRADNYYFGKRILITWCDLYPTLSIQSMPQLPNGNWVAINGVEHRYGYDKAIRRVKLLSEATGDVVGIYHLENFQGFPLSKEEDDIADILESNYGEMDAVQLSDVVDFGDWNKLTKLHHQDEYKFVCRHFNSIVPSEKGLVKRSVNAQGDAIIQKEIAWYQAVISMSAPASSASIPLPIPTIYGLDLEQHQFEMELLSADPLYRIFPNLTQEKQTDVIGQILQALDRLHQLDQKTVTVEEMERDVLREIVGKIIQRTAEIQPIIDCFGPIHTVNGRQILTLRQALAKTKKIILDYHRSQVTNANTNALFTYCLIHGDCQFSNTLYDREKEQIYLIDPRGYFGETLVYGCPEYDYAKVLYALSGYDGFNTKFDFALDKLESGQLWITIPELIHSIEIVDILYRPVIRAYMVVNWLGLAQYNVNHPLKCLASYYYGLYLASTLS